MALKLRTVRAPYSCRYTVVPDIKTPITSKENFELAVKRADPIWVPSMLMDFQSLGAQDVVTKDVRGMQVHTNFRKPATEDYVFTDWFNTSWTWVCSANGAMLTPGTMLLDDITRWEEVVEFPDLSEWDFDETAAHFMNEEYEPDKVLHFDIGRGCTERFISIMGGYSEGLVAMAEEPEATRDFLECFADFEIALFDKLHSLYPFDMITYHDDWGTERDTFFSEKMMEEIVYHPTKRIIDHIKSSGVAFELHSCGNIKRFLPYMIELGADFLQLQRRAVDIPELKKIYGKEIGFNAGIEGYEMGKKYSSSEIAELVKNTVDTYASGGGFYASVFASDETTQCALLKELYSYSTQYYNRQS